MTAATSYRFLRTPLWLAGIGLAVAGVVVFVALGMWQLSRLEEKRSFNELLTSRLEASVEPLDAVLAAGGGDPEGVRFRRVVATGTFDAGAEVLLAGRTNKGRPGYHVLTPLVVAPGQAIVVDRGWVPIDVAGPPVASAPPPSGIVAVSGVVDTSPAGRTFGSAEAGSRVERIGAVDLTRLDDQIPASLYPVYLRMETVDGRVPSTPVAAGPEELGEGPHLGYAVQWFVFAAIVVIGFPILVYRTARSSGNLHRSQPRQAGEAR